MDKGEVNGSSCSSCTHVFCISPQKRHLGMVVALFILMGVGVSSHFKHRCSSSFPGDMLRLVNTAKQANGIYFCLCHVQPTIHSPLSHAVSFQWRVYIVCQDTEVAKKNNVENHVQSGGDVWVKLCIQRSSFNPWILDLLSMCLTSFSVHASNLSLFHNKCQLTT